MLELKLVRGLARLYATGLTLSVKSLNRRDAQALKKYHARQRTADEIENTAKALWDHAADVRAEAEQKLGVTERTIVAALNEVQNREDDLLNRLDDLPELDGRLDIDATFLKNIPEAKDE